MARLHRELAGLATDWVQAKRFQLQRGTPQTVTDSGGSVKQYTWHGQELDRGELRKVKQIREKGGVVAFLFEAKATMRFGTGAELQSENDDLQAWLDDNFGNVDLLTLDLGADATWYPYGLGETVETRGGDFSHIEPVEPWTMLPQTNAHGDVVLWEQLTKGEHEPRPFDPEDIGSIVLNKASGRDRVGVSEVLRSEEEITSYKQNQEAVNKAIEIAGFPHHIWTVGSEGRTPVDDTDLRRVRNLIDNMDGDTQFVVGPDVAHDKITAADFAFEDVTKRDLRILTTAVGLPLEVAGYGREGMGSGSEADLIMSLLALQNEVARRRYEVQFVREFVEPVVRDYSPFDADAEPIDMHIPAFLDDTSELADLISQIGEYMSNAEVRDKLDLPPLEDDEISDAYRSPEAIEEAEEGPDEPGGLPGGGGGFFSDGRALQEVPDNANPISDRSECPDGNVIQGPRGGLYCVPTGDGGAADGDVSPGEEVPIEEMDEGDEVVVDATINVAGEEYDISDDVVEIRIANENGLAIEHPDHGTATIPAEEIESVTAPEDEGTDADTEDVDTEVGADDPAADIDGAVSQAIEAVDFDDTIALPESPGDEPALSPEQSEAFETALSQAIDNADVEATAEDVTSVYDQTQAWKTSSYNDEAQTTERMIAAATGVSDNYRNDTLDGREPTEGEVQAMGAVVEAARQFAADEYGDGATASRGISQEATVGFMGDFLSDPDTESTDINENTVANYSVSPDVARSFSKGGVVVERDLNADEIVGAPDLIQNHRAERHTGEGEVWLPGGQSDVTTDQVTFQTRDGESVSAAQIQEEGLDNLSEESLTVLAKPIDAMIGPAQSGDLRLDDSQRESLERIRDRAEEAGIESTMLNAQDVLDNA